MNKAVGWTTLLLIATSLANPAFAVDGKSTTVPAAGTVAVPTQGISKEQAVDLALKAHPGTVTKAYQDTKKGKKTWEVQINGSDGRKWEVHYEISSGVLVADERR